MPITVRCDCGKRTTVGDPLAGKTIRCPGCGGELFVPTGAPTTAAITQARRTAAAGSAIHMSGGTMTMLSVGGVVGLVILVALLGPVRVRHEWNALGSKPQDDVQNIVDFGLKAWLSQRGAYNPRNSHGAPAVDSVGLDEPYLAFSMPDKVPFAGRTNQGKFFGFYHPKTREVEARIEYGGYSFAGMVDISKAAGQVKLTGRIGPDGQPQAEDEKGNKLTLHFPPPSEE